MYKALFTQIQTHVRHLSVDIEEHKIANLQLSSPHHLGGGPQLSRRSRQRLTGLRVRVLHEPAAIEASRTAATVSIGDTHLVHCYGRRRLAYARA